jgi:hypothetical protein
MQSIYGHLKIRINRIITTTHIHLFGAAETGLNRSLSSYYGGACRFRAEYPFPVLNASFAVAGQRGLALRLVHEQSENRPHEWIIGKFNKHVLSGPGLKKRRVSDMTASAPV